MATIFLERDNQSYEMDIRLFIEGVEVTDWVAENIGVTISGTGGMNQLSFTLANPEDCWILTPQNLAGEWRKGGLYGEEGKRAIYTVKKAREEEAKNSIKNMGNAKTALTDTGVYNLGPEQVVFHKHDCVRLFVRNPVVREEAWMFGFTGFIDTHPFTDDYIGGSVPLNFQCYDIKGLMKRMRVALQPMPSAGLNSKGIAQTGKNLAPLLTKEGILGPEAGMFEDLMDTRGLNHVLAGKNFKEVMNFLFLGEGGIMGGDFGANKFAVSLFGGQVKANLPLDKATATAPQKLSSKEQEIVDKFDQLNNKPLSMKIGGYTTTGAHKDPGTYEQFSRILASDKDLTELRRLDENAKVLASVLKEAEATNKRNRQVKKSNNQPQETDSPLSTISTAPAFAFKRGHVGRMMKGWEYEYPGANLEEWHNLLLTVNKQGRYLTPEQVSLLGHGTVLENVLGSPYNAQLHMLLPASGIDAKTFAQVDFATHDFNSGISFMTRYELVEHVAEQIDYQWFVTPAGDVAMEFPMYDFTPRIFGRYKTTLTVEKHAISASVEDEATDIPTALVVTAQESGNNTGTAEMQSGNDPNRLVVYAPLLAARLGATVEQISSPVSIGGAVTGGSSIGGGGIRGAEAWALLQMQKRLGQSSTLSLPIPYRPWLLPNRPLLHIPRQRIGIIHQIQHSLTIGGVCQTTPVMNYVKKKHSDGKFRYPTSGGENMPINYATMFSQSGDVEHSGITIRKGITSGTSAVPQGDSATRPVPGTFPGTFSDANQKRQVESFKPDIWNNKCSFAKDIIKACLRMGLSIQTGILLASHFALSTGWGKNAHNYNLAGLKIDLSKNKNSPYVLLGGNECIVPKGGVPINTVASLRCPPGTVLSARKPMAWRAFGSTDEGLAAIIKQLKSPRYESSYHMLLSGDKRYWGEVGRNGWYTVSQAVMMKEMEGNWQYIRICCMREPQLRRLLSQASLL